ncbi:MAG: HipA N-terminal domain-containing protein [Bulleidia sp.]
MIEQEEAYVYVKNEYAGILSKTDRGYRFIYDEAYLKKENPYAVSLTLPCRKEPYDSRFLFPFFDGLIPEGWMLEIIVRNWKINPKDRFAILLCACRDCVGDVSVRREKI